MSVNVKDVITNMVGVALADRFDANVMGDHIREKEAQERLDALAVFSPEYGEDICEHCGRID